MNNKELAALLKVALLLRETEGNPAEIVTPLRRALDAKLAGVEFVLENNRAFARVATLVDKVSNGLMKAQSWYCEDGCIEVTFVIHA